MVEHFVLPGHSVFDLNIISLLQKNFKQGRSMTFVGPRHLLPPTIMISILKHFLYNCKYMNASIPPFSPCNMQQFFSVFRHKRFSCKSDSWGERRRPEEQADDSSRDLCVGARKGNQEAGRDNRMQRGAKPANATWAAADKGLKKEAGQAGRPLVCSSGHLRGPPSPLSPPSRGSWPRRAGRQPLNCSLALVRRQATCSLLPAE